MGSDLTVHTCSYPFISPTHFTSTLTDKIVLITGASRGIGLSTALAFAAAGARVALVARSQTDLDSVVSTIKTRFDVPALAIALDITSPSAPAHIIQEIARHFGGPADILVNNAGALRYNTFEAEPSFAAWHSVFSLNFAAPLALIHATLPSMLARGAGTIISVGSLAGVQASPFCTAYATAKAALVKFHAELEAEISGRGVSTFVVHPGEVDTGMAKVPGAVDLQTVMRTERMAKFLQGWEHLQTQPPELAADTMVALCVVEGRERLSGGFVDAKRDLEELIEGKGGRGRSGREGDG
ncbi:hypothetical protein MMC24_000718 [Lignoscripta atroalba]|nr:hypothetical protein [Lignoscripta atroalba]